MRIEIDQLALTGEGYLAPSDIHEEREVLKTNYTHAELMVPAVSGCALLYLHRDHKNLS